MSKAGAVESGAAKAAGTRPRAAAAKGARRAKGACKAGGRRKAGTRRKAGGWTPAKEEIFFRELSILCNVAAALRAANLVRAYPDPWKRRRTESDFAERWEQAIGESTERLRLELHARARLGEDRPAPKDEAEAKLRAVPTSLGLQLLKMYENRARAATRGAQRPMRGTKLKEQLEKRLAEISRRLGGVD